MTVREIKHAHMCCGVGMAAKGFNAGHARVGTVQARFRCIGGIDNDAQAIANFNRIANVRGTVMDLFSRSQYVRFHGSEPPPGWREAMPADVIAAFNNELPDIVFMSTPCKGYSGLLSEARSLTDRYQALNELALRVVWLVLEAYKDDPVPLIGFENVPRIQTRGRDLLDQIEDLFTAYGYASNETNHDCGEIADPPLSQGRNRFLLMARHLEKVPPFLYEPVKRPLRAVGDVLGKMRMPDDPVAGPMHRMPRLQWRTWVRLAFIRPGKDWRDLQRLQVENGFLKDYAIAPDSHYHGGAYGVQRWEDVAGTVTGNGRPASGTFSVADPRVDGHEKSVQMGVRPWDQPAPAVTASMFVGTGPNSVADPRIDGVKHNNCFRIVRWDEFSPSVTGGGGPSAGGLAVGDPRYGWEDAHESKMRVQRWHDPSRTITGSDRVGSGALSVADPRPEQGWQGGKYGVTSFNEPAGTVIGASTTGNGAFAVADPRTRREYRDNPYGVLPWDRPSGAVTGSAGHDNGFHSVADPRVHGTPAESPTIALPAPTERLVCVIRSLDGTWHRPFTTLELAALQSLYDPEEDGDVPFTLDSSSDSTSREWIGNGCPSRTCAAIAGVMGEVILLAEAGETFRLGSTPIWVRDVAIALSVAKSLPT